MKLEIFSVYDKAIGAYLTPFFSRSKGEALRSFSEACNDEKSNFFKHGADYHLVYLGSYDDNSGDFSPVHPVKLVSALECKLDDVFKEETRIHSNSVGKGLPM